MQMENIARFLEGAQKAGVPQHDLFQTVDLFEDKNRMQVVDAIWSLSRHAYKNGSVSTVSMLLVPILNENYSKLFTFGQLVSWP